MTLQIKTPPRMNRWRRFGCLATRNCFRGAESSCADFQQVPSDPVDESSTCAHIWSTTKDSTPIVQRTLASVKGRASATPAGKKLAGIYELWYTECGCSPFFAFGGLVVPTRRFWYRTGPIMALLVAFLIIFPGRQAPMALSLATGIGTAGLQARVDRLEEQAILGRDFTEADKAFLRDLYTCMAKGGRLIVVARQSGAMMNRYLEASGEDLHTEPRIFLGSRRVRYEMTLMKRWMLREAGQPGGLQESYVSRTFHMADPKFFESLVGLHYGRLIAKPRRQRDGTLSIRWRAEVPWHWPPYEYLQRRYGNYHAWCFPVPNARSLLFGKKHCLWIDDGLGNHLVELGLAKPFLVYSEWNESRTSPDR